MRTTAEIVREAVKRAARECHMTSSLWPDIRHMASLAATYACEMAQADAAALLKPVTMRKSDRRTLECDEPER